ncbi:uncharacterized protein LOC141670498 isoform X2 [Apium graveolens]|uniref:uncharacterized protein LOC141670498 isoform X2 n=1 Tax=Apium graveolens TaxID=4045 RepID=UPI003D7B2394
MKRNCGNDSFPLYPSKKERISTQVDHFVCYDLFVSDWLQVGADFDFFGSRDGRDLCEMLDSSDNSDSESRKTKGLKRNAVNDIATTSGSSENVSVDQLSNVASTYLKRPKTHDPTTSVSTNLELEHKVRKLRTKATALRGLLKLTQIPESRLLEMDHLLTVICETFSIPLAQYWVVTDPYFGRLRVMCQKGNTKFGILKPWCEFKTTCLQMHLNVGKGLVGNTFLSHKSLFCKDIKELSTTCYPMAQYPLNCGSIACFTVCLHSISPKYTECVLEFFLPSQEMDSFYPQTLLNSLLATMKEHLPYYIVASGEQLGQVLSVDIISTYTVVPQSFKVGQPNSSLSYHEDSKKEGDILYIEKSNSAINNDEATTSGGTSKCTPVNVAEITDHELEEESLFKCSKSQSLTSQLKRTKKIVEGERSILRIDHSAFEMNLKKGINHRGESAVDELGDELEEVSPSMLIESQSLASQPKRSEESLEDEGNTVKIFNSAMVVTSEEAILQKEHTVAEKRDQNGSSIFCFVDDLTVVIGVEGSTVEDIGYTASTASQPSNFQTMILLPQQVLDEDTSTQELILEHVLRTRIVGVEKDKTTIHSASKTCIHETSEREKQSKNGNSFQKIYEQFGRRLDDAANCCSGNELEKESPMMCIKPQSITSQPNRSGKISKEIGSTAEIDHSSSEITFEEATNHKEQTKAAQTAGFTVDEPIDESPIDNAVYATSDKDIKTMSIASEPSILETMRLLPLFHVEEDTMVLQDEGDASQQLPCIPQPLYRDGIEEDEQVLDITECTPNVNPSEEIATDETSKRQPDNVADIICFDGLKEESSIQCTEPRSLTPRSKRTENILKDDGNIIDIDHYAPDMILKEAIQYRGHTVADQGGNITFSITGKTISMPTLLIYTCT